MAEINWKEWAKDGIRMSESSALKCDSMMNSLTNSPANSIVEQIAKISGDKIKVHYDTVANEYTLSPEDIVTASSQWANASSFYNPYYTDPNEVYVDYMISNYSLYIQDENNNCKKIHKRFTSYDEAYSYVSAKISAIENLYKKELKNPLIDVQFADKSYCLGRYFAEMYINKDASDNQHFVRFALQFN